jgi:hypothetical protein
MIQGFAAYSSFSDSRNPAFTAFESLKHNGLISQINPPSREVQSFGNPAAGVVKRQSEGSPGWRPIL